jgi:hypothetical protein
VEIVTLSLDGNPSRMNDADPDQQHSHPDVQLDFHLYKTMT